MRLTEFLTGQKSIKDTGKTQQSTVRNDAVNRQIRSLTPGQTIQGEVVSRNGSEVQIRLADDMMLQARIDRNMNIEIGKNMTFEVKNNGQSLMLSPLFTNTAVDVNVLKALDMASLPINETTVEMTKQLMEAGLSVDRNTLQQVNRECNLFPEAETADIINLHKLGLPVNEDNVAQMASYRNLTYRLVTGLNDVLDTLPDLFAQLTESGDVEGAVRLYEQLLSLAQDTEGMAAGGEDIFFQKQDAVFLEAGNTNAEGLAGTNAEGEAGSPSAMAAEAILKGMTGETSEGILSNEQGPVELQSGKDALKTQIPPEYSGGELQEAADAKESQQKIVLEEKTGLTEEGLRSAQALSGSNAADTGGGASLQTILSARAFEQVLSQLFHGTGMQAENVKQELDGLLNPLLQLMKKQWTVSPKEVADTERVEGLYRRLDRQLKSLAQTMESTGQTAASAYKAVTGLSRNLDFLQQVNQAYNYIQLPLRLQQGEAHGDLYVYTNKRHLARKDGQISALLHLDMEHLGAVDVYVSMVSENVSTKFYVQDDDMLDFLTGHMDILTERLQKRGYSCSFEMNVREQGEQKESIVGKILGQESAVPLAEYAFDVRT